MKVALFSSQTCRDCRQIRQLMDVMVRRYGIEWVDYQIEQGIEPFEKYNVSGTPVMVVLDGDTEIGRFLGHQTDTSLESKLKHFGVVNV